MGDVSLCLTQVFIERLLLPEHGVERNKQE
jgi:hypothetical protein